MTRFIGREKELDGLKGLLKKKLAVNYRFTIRGHAEEVEIIDYH